MMLVHGRGLGCLLLPPQDPIRGPRPMLGKGLTLQTTYETPGGQGHSRSRSTHFTVRLRSR